MGPRSGKSTPKDHLLDHDKSHPRTDIQQVLWRAISADWSKKWNTTGKIFPRKCKRARENVWEKDKTAYLVCLYHSERSYNSIKKFIDELVRSAKRTKVKWVKSLSRVWHFVTPWTVAYGLLHPWDFPGKSTGVGCHCLLQGIFLTQGSNSGLPHCRQTLYRLIHQGPIKRTKAMAKEGNY